MARATDGVTFIEVQVRPGNRADIGRPTSTPAAKQSRYDEIPWSGVTRMTKILSGIGSLSQLSDIRAEFNAKTVMLVTGKASYAQVAPKASLMRR